MMKIMDEYSETPMKECVELSDKCFKKYLEDCWGSEEKLALDSAIEFLKSAKDIYYEKDDILPSVEFEEALDFSIYKMIMMKTPWIEATKYQFNVEAVKAYIIKLLMLSNEIEFA